MMMRKFFGRLPILGLSFVLAMVLYLFVQVQNSPTKGPIPILVKLETTGLSPQFYAYTETSVQATVAGPTDAVDQFLSDKGKLTATVDLTSAKLGTGEFQVKLAVPPNTPLHFNLRDRYAKVRLVGLVVKNNVPVRASLTGQMSVQTQFELHGFELRPARVTLRGPSDQIDSVVPTATIDLSHVNSESDVVEVQVVNLDKKGALVDSVTATPASVQAYPILIPKPQTKQIVLNVKFSGSLAQGLSLERWNVTPQAVTVHGSSEALAKLVTASVTVDLSKLTNAGWNQVSVTPELPAGVTMSPVVSVEVKVQLAPSPVVPTTGVSPPPSNP